MGAIFFQKLRTVALNKSFPISHLMRLPRALRTGAKLRSGSLSWNLETSVRHVPFYARIFGSRHEPAVLKLYIPESGPALSAIRASCKALPCSGFTHIHSEREAHLIQDVRMMARWSNASMDSPDTKEYSPRLRLWIMDSLAFEQRRTCA